jgi:pilus assembly protein Flp/PilA
VRCETLPSLPARTRALARTFLRDRSGATALEYGLICALIFLSITGSVTYFSNRTNLMYNKITTNMP